ncbi:hypothetical protein M0638_24020 [Roseomonas sp. NAR14]|uniref:Uncharacterized protein n=1 Tax=Roseomonas acroporae TaxID=2937791 RepID=A0A9X1YJR4_9PROT|nr:hypothetical protein [Roseomonas acroporae]MCK8787441.1 hypothetical protein [Roseomonas acroporae]
MSRRRTGRAAGQGAARPTGPESNDLAQLRRELDEARTRLRAIEQQGIAKVTADRLAALDEGQKVARGQALDAVLARNQAEAELRALRDAIAKAPGVSGWLIRRAARRLVERGG